MTVSLIGISELFSNCDNLSNTICLDSSSVGFTFTYIIMEHIIIIEHMMIIDHMIIVMKKD